GAGALPVATQAANDQRYVPDEVLVKFATTTSTQAIFGIAQDQRLSLLGTHPLPLINSVLYRFRITDRRNVPAVIGSLQGDGRIAAVQPNYLYELKETDVTQQSAASPMQYAVSKMHLTEAHGLATGNHVLIALIDSAVDTRHPELQGVVTGGLD